MNIGKGVLTIAHGQSRFARQAVNLARSIRLRDPNLPLAVVTDLPAALFEGIYDHVIPWNFAGRSGLVSKLDAYEMSPFDVTLFLDTDILMFTSLQPVFEHFAGDEFSVIGQLQAETGWFESTALMHEEFAVEAFPRFVGGLYYFVKSETAAGVFREAHAIHLRYDELRIKLHEGMRNDEPIFSVAMARTGMHARKARTPGLLINPTWWPVRSADIDVIAGRCDQFENKKILRRAMMHFYDGRTHSYFYIREVLRLKAAFRNADRTVRREGLIRLCAVVLWLCAPPRIVWKMHRFIKKGLQKLMR